MRPVFTRISADSIRQVRCSDLVQIESAHQLACLGYSTRFPYVHIIDESGADQVLVDPKALLREAADLNRMLQHGDRLVSCGVIRMLDSSIYLSWARDIQVMTCAPQGDLRILVDRVEMIDQGLRAVLNIAEQSGGLQTVNYLASLPERVAISLICLADLDFGQRRNLPKHSLPKHVALVRSS